MPAVTLTPDKSVIATDCAGTVVQAKFGNAVKAIVGAAASIEVPENSKAPKSGFAERVTFA